MRRVLRFLNPLVARYPCDGERRRLSLWLCCRCSSALLFACGFLRSEARRNFSELPAIEAKLFNGTLKLNFRSGVTLLFCGLQFRSFLLSSGLHRSIEQFVILLLQRIVLLLQIAVAGRAFIQCISILLRTLLHSHQVSLHRLAQRNFAFDALFNAGRIALLFLGCKFRFFSKIRVICYRYAQIVVIGFFGGFFKRFISRFRIVFCWRRCCRVFKINVVINAVENNVEIVNYFFISYCGHVSS